MEPTNQVKETEDVIMEDVSTVAVEAVNAEEAGTVKEDIVTAPIEKAVEDTQIAQEEVHSSDIKETKEESSIEDIMSKSKPIEEIKGAKDGTPDWLQKRLDKQAKQNRDALHAKDEEIASLKEQALPDERPPMPILEDYLTREEYQSACQEWKDQDDNWKISNKRKAEATIIAQDKVDQNIQRFKDGSVRMAEQYDDFNKIVNEDTVYEHLSDIILATDFASEIAYHLGIHTDKLEKIKSMDAISATFAIGELSSQCKSYGTKSVTTAPGILTPVKDSEGGGNSTDFSLSDIEKISREFLNTA